MPLFPDIEKMLCRLDYPIPPEREQLLDELVKYLDGKISSGVPVRLIFICTHNSRRSHIAQVWSQALACYYGFHRIQCYSGGTEVTALNPEVVKVLRQSGFAVEPIAGKVNPVYFVKFSRNEHPVICFSKPWWHDFNPRDDFAAIMTCDTADEACPVVSGADFRLALPFEDPGRYDHSPDKTEHYRQVNRQIATELNYVFSKIQQK